MSLQPGGQGGVLPTLDVAIGDLNLAKEATGVMPAKVAFDSASVLLTLIRVRLHSAHAGRFLADAHRTRRSKEVIVSS